MARGPDRLEKNKLQSPCLVIHYPGRVIRPEWLRPPEQQGAAPAAISSLAGNDAYAAIRPLQKRYFRQSRPAILNTFAMICIMQ